MPKPLGNGWKEVKRWWFTRAWWIRYGGYSIALVGGFYGVENLRGNWAWKRHLDQVHVEAAELRLPAQRSSEEGVITLDDTRFVREIAEDYDLSAEWYLFPNPDEFDPTNFATIDGQGSVLIDGLDFARCFPELDALGTLSQAQAVDHALEEMRKVEEQLALYVEAAGSTPGPLSPRPVLRSADMASMSSLSVSLIRTFGHTVGFRGHLRLAQGDSQAALKDAIALLRFARCLAQRGRLIDTTVALVTLVPARSLIWHGLDTRAWNAEQLQELREALEWVEPARWTQWALWAERERFLPLILSLESGPLTRHRANREWGFVNLPNPPYFQSELEPLRAETSHVLCALMPGGWARDAGAQYCSELDLAIRIAGEVNPIERQGWVDRAKRLQDSRAWSDELLAGMLLIGVGAYAEPPMQFETFVRQLRLAVALERAWLNIGDYPSFDPTELESVGVELPIDPFSGKPMTVKLGSNGRPFFYSWGPNGIDDGGVAGATSETGDMIWTYRDPKLAE